MKKDKIQCSRKNCFEKAKYICGGAKYCTKHKRFRKMVNWANIFYQPQIGIQDLDELFDKCFPDKNNVGYPKCGIKLEWEFGKYNPKIITLQHWENGKLEFLCHYCNSVHGASNNKFILDIPKNKKWCPQCQQIKSRDQFYKNKSNSIGINCICKVCQNYNTKIYKERKK